MALRDLDNTPITLQSLVPMDRAPLISHWHPFNSLPLIESHFHPKFAIFNAGAKLAKMMVLKDPDNVKKFMEKLPSLLSIIDLYNVWIQAPTPDVKTAISYNAPLDLPDDGDDNNNDNNNNDDDNDYCQTRSQGSKKWKAPTVELAVKWKHHLTHSSTKSSGG